LGFYVAYRADSELDHFRAAKKNKGKVLDTGLWRYSRHPNYFGEILQWFGIGLVAAQTSFGWVGLIGPLFLAYVIYYFTGVPVVEEAWSKDKHYQEYVARTSCLLPWPPKAQ
jgi:steroid 5-alpha reductase family enzyme